MKKVAVLGATGSIGKSSLDVLRQGGFKPMLFTSHTNYQLLLKLKEEFPTSLLALSGRENTPALVDYSGRQGLLDAIAACDADIIINGISGAAGLEPSIAALKSRACLALANKESIVMAGSLILALGKERIIPVDSEHSAIFFLIKAHGKENIEEIFITASGGPFRNYTPEMLAKVSPREALEHPIWNMGPKISVDSATLANKGLEVIEAAQLFEFPPEKIQVLIHPQSIVHSMLRLKDGTIYCQMSKPDMRHPIHSALHWPEIVPSSIAALNENLDFRCLSLDFENPDSLRFPMLSLAYTACREGPLYPVVYNAANESAVEAFLEGRISFLEIPRIVEYVLSSGLWSINHEPGLAEILEADNTARNMVFNSIGRK